MNNCLKWYSTYTSQLILDSNFFSVSLSAGLTLAEE